MGTPLIPFRARGISAPCDYSIAASNTVVMTTTKHQLSPDRR